MNRDQMSTPVFCVAKQQDDYLYMTEQEQILYEERTTEERFPNYGPLNMK
jgi:hypothetical protein